jgi:DNA-binding transcriptional LysR family regulator
MLSELHPADIKLLRTFLAVVDAGGLSAAQPRLNRSLGSISADIKTLELRFGRQVCIRGRSGFALTEQGRHLCESGRRLFENIDQFVSDWQSNPATLTGALRIAVNESQISDPNFVLPAAVSRFHGRPKNSVKIGIQMAYFEQVQEMLLRNEIEVGFGYFRTARPGIQMAPLFRERNQIYCGRGHPLFTISDGKITEAMVRAHPFVFRGTVVPGLYPRALEGISGTGTGMTPESRAYLLLSGRYLGYLAEHHAEPWVREGLLRPVRPDLLGIDFLFQIAIRKSGKRANHVKAFLEDYFAVARERGVAGLGNLD